MMEAGYRRLSGSRGSAAGKKLLTVINISLLIALLAAVYPRLCEMGASEIAAVAYGKVLEIAEAVTQARSERFTAYHVIHPARCFEGASGFHQIKLPLAIVPMNVTIEEISPAHGLPYTRRNAPKHCRVSGWLRSDRTEAMVLLVEFNFNPRRGSRLTYRVGPATVSVDAIRFDFTSNHGSHLRTCVGRLTVRGRLTTIPSAFKVIQMKLLEYLEMALNG